MHRADGDQLDMSFTHIGPGRIEYECVDIGTSGTSPIVMLHEGLGSVSMWKDFPERLARATQSRVIVYSRHGHGRSAPLRGPRSPRYMHEEALTVLPQLLDHLRIDNPILFGHSDGGSIVLLHAGAGHRAVRGIVTLAPHVMVEEIAVRAIAAARVAYQTTDLRARLARYHDDVDGVFWGWNDIWLHPAFRCWDIQEYLPRIRCPILAIQGEEDEYGTMMQVDLLARGASNVARLPLSNCGHSPHRDRSDAVLEAVANWPGQSLGPT
jgi:pimeloyl-ACP methyl ester carboxylesterase